LQSEYIIFKNMKLNQRTIRTELQYLQKGKKIIFKNEKGKLKVFFLKNEFYFITFDGNEIETIKDLEAVYETVIGILEINE
jgi:hypothetical protein